ncbi:MAG: nucleotidyltransferase domain-containing protein [Verrucomicrobia bacterium]|nr:nucleotidyltransferase domain-containing protein [Verrucomicrobiota bacterium]
MRLSKAQTETIVTIIRQRLGCDAQVQVFGSMTNDRARGGDVDLLVSSPKRVDLTERARIGLVLEQALGLPVDLVFVEEGKPQGSFERLAAATSEPLAHVP